MSHKKPNIFLLSRYEPRLSKTGTVFVFAVEMASGFLLMSQVQGNIKCLTMSPYASSAFFHFY